MSSYTAAQLQLRTIRRIRDYRCERQPASTSLMLVKRQDIGLFSDANFDALEEPETGTHASSQRAMQGHIPQAPA